MNNDPLSRLWNLGGKGRGRGDHAVSVVRAIYMS